MKSDSFILSVQQEFRKTYIAIFEQDWPSWLAAILIAILAIFMLLWEGPWGITGGYRNLGDWLWYLMGIYAQKPQTLPWLHTMSVSDFGLIGGALVSALMSRQFKIRRAPIWEYVKGFAGGILMGAGSVLAAGCNVGGFFTACGMLDIGGIAMMIGLGLGAFIGLKLLLLEMEHVPQHWTVIDSEEAKPSTINWDRVQPVLGFVAVFLIILGFYLYSALDLTQIGGLLFLGSLIGFTMHRSRFCFVRAFRCPFMTGEAEMVKAVALSLMIYGSGTAIIKWSYLQEPSMGVYHNFWFGSFVGGIVFGIGMLLAGGCGSSTLWRVGEGHVKLMITLITFALTNSAVAALLDKYDLTDHLGKGIFMPKIFTWYATLPLFIIYFLLWALWAIWNEKTEKFVIF